MSITYLYRPHPLTIDKSATVKEALDLMIKKESNGLIVTKNNTKIVGILSLQDIAGAILPAEMKENVSLAHAMYKDGFFEEMARKIGNKKVTEFARTAYKTVSPDASIFEVAAEFLQNDLYIIPVVSHDKLIGVISRSEIKRALALAMNLHE